MPERIETVIIGGGQAGLAMSYYLGQLGREHIILERGRVAERWRTERWDSLAFQVPKWMMRLPGYAYTGDDADGFMLRDSVARFIEDYARHIAPPLRCGFRVTALREVSGTRRLAVDTEHFSLEATNVVVATGPYQEPLVPGCSAAFPLATYQLTANRYTNSDQLRPGRVLVVGSGASGYQIADDLLQSGRDVYLSVGRHRRVPRRYRGKDFGWWQDKMGLGERIAESVSGGVLPPLLTGVSVRPAASSARARLADLAARNRIPAIYGHSAHPEAGGLMSYAANRFDVFRHVAIYVDKILKGAKPADLPVEQPLASSP